MTNPADVLQGMLRHLSPCGAGLDAQSFKKANEDLTGPPWEAVPSSATAMDTWKWSDGVRKDKIIDFDGHGFYARSVGGELRMYREHTASAVRHKQGRPHPDGFTHVVWFRR